LTVDLDFYRADPVNDPYNPTDDFTVVVDDNNPLGSQAGLTWSTSGFVYAVDSTNLKQPTQHQDGAYAVYSSDPGGTVLGGFSTASVTYDYGWSGTDNNTSRCGGISFGNVSREYAYIVGLQHTRTATRVGDRIVIRTQKIIGGVGSPNPGNPGDPNGDPNVRADRWLEEFVSVNVPQTDGTCQMKATFAINGDGSITITADYWSTPGDDVNAPEYTATATVTPGDHQMSLYGEVGMGRVGSRNGYPLFEDWTLVTDGAFVPEPATVALLLLGSGMLIRKRR
jgi:hypothetical protein